MAALVLLLSSIAINGRHISCNPGPRKHSSQANEVHTVGTPVRRNVETGEGEAKAAVGKVLRADDRFVSIQVVEFISSAFVREGVNTAGHSINVPVIELPRLRSAAKTPDHPPSLPVNKMHFRLTRCCERFSLT